MQSRDERRLLIALGVGVAGVGLIAALAFTSDRSPGERSAWSPTAQEGPLQIRVTGREYFWRYCFPGPDAAFDTEDDVCVDRVVHLPVERDIIFQMTSDDFVYTMSIPQLKLRQVAIPELFYTLKFRPTTAGVFDVLADPMCGVRFFHDDDMGRVIVQPEAAFDAWYARAQ